MIERRMATPVYNRKMQNDWISLMGVSFVVGAMLGAAIALAFVSL